MAQKIVTVTTRIGVNIYHAGDIVDDRTAPTTDLNDLGATLVVVGDSAIVDAAATTARARRASGQSEGGDALMLGAYVRAVTVGEISVTGTMPPVGAEDSVLAVTAGAPAWDASPDAVSFTGSSFIAGGEAPPDAGQLRLGTTGGGFKAYGNASTPQRKLILEMDAAGNNAWFGNSAVAAERIVSMIIDGGNGVFLRSAGTTRFAINTNTCVVSNGPILLQGGSSYQNLTLSVNITLTLNGSPHWHKLAPNGASRTVTLPSEASSPGLWYFIKNTDGAFDIDVREDGGTTVGVVLNTVNGTAAVYVSNGTTWIQILL